MTTKQTLRNVASQIRAGERVDLDALRELADASYRRAEIRELATSIEDHIDEGVGDEKREDIAQTADAIADLVDGDED